jgi:NAD+ synthase (glutamine-hydrolysing)
MKIAIAQINFFVGGLEGNAQKMIQSILRAKKGGFDLIIFSELALCGYPPEDLLLHDRFIDTAERILEEIATVCEGITVILGTVRRNRGRGEKPLCNSAAIISNQKILGFHDKWLLPTYDVFDERRYFEPGNTLQVWPCGKHRLGILICEDIWQHAGYLPLHYLRDPIAEMKALEPTLLINLSASPYQFQKPELRTKVCSSSARALNVPMILCAQVGGNDQLVFDGYSLVMNAQGELLKIAKGFEEDFIEIDLERLPPKITFSFHPLSDLYQALVLGIKDYFHKQGLRKGCIGVSGGIDSAVCTCIAVDALGKENVLAVRMPSPYTSSSSMEDAETLANHLGIELVTLSIEEPFALFLEVLKPLFADLPVNVAEENIQARIRGLLLMAISNKLCHIVLSTGNKSELALGYCTLYGDMCGGIGVLSDVTKTQVYALARWINREKEIIPQSCLDKPPSAELKANQKDTDTLPDYAIVDAVLQAYVEDSLDAEEIVTKYGIPLPLVQELIRRIHAAEYKRRQAAPGIRVSKKTFGVGRRYPIVQGWC